MGPEVVAALIAGVVSVAVVFVNYVIAQGQAQQRSIELSLKEAEIKQIGEKLKDEAEAFQKKLQADTNALKQQLEADARTFQQSALQDVLTRRMDAYAALWNVFITFERNWSYEQKPLNLSWATEFLVAINECNAKHGVFFSEEVYKPFFEYRRRVLAIRDKAQRGEMIGDQDIDLLRQVSTSGVIEMLPLATALKNDLGSYIPPALRAN